MFNGERFVEEAVTSLLAQTIDDIEVVVSDNASTDRTVEIVRRLAQHDRRVRLITQPVNRGVVENFDQVMQHARGRYFAWAAHDDLRAPDFARRCIDALESDAAAVLAYTRAITIDDNGTVLRSSWGARPELVTPSTRVRFRAALAPPNDPMPLPLFGVIRSDVLDRTGLLVPGPHYDRALVAELAIHGPFVEIAETSFVQREHAARLGPSIAGDARDAARRLGSHARLPQWQLLARHLASVRRAPRGAGAGALYLEVLRWAGRERHELIDDLIHATASGIGRSPVIGDRVAASLAVRPARRWARLERRIGTHLMGATPTGACIVVIDDDSFGSLEVGARQIVPLWSADGESWGTPASEDEIVAELDARVAEGATHIAVTRPARWVVDFHAGVREWLAARCVPVTETVDVDVFRMLPQG